MCPREGRQWKKEEVARGIAYDEIENTDASEGLWARVRD